MGGWLMLIVVLPTLHDHDHHCITIMLVIESRLLIDIYSKGQARSTDSTFCNSCTKICRTSLQFLLKTSAKLRKRTWESHWPGRVPVWNVLAANQRNHAVHRPPESGRAQNQGTVSAQQIDPVPGISALWSWVRISSVSMTWITSYHYETPLFRESIFITSGWQFRPLWKTDSLGIIFPLLVLNVRM